MAEVATIAFFLGVIAYSVAATLFFIDLVRPDAAGARVHWAPRALVLGALAHAAHVVSASLLSRVCPVESLHFGLSFSGLIAVGVYLVGILRIRQSKLLIGWCFAGSIAIPIACLYTLGDPLFLLATRTLSVLLIEVAALISSEPARGRPS